jgi:transketolase
MTAASPSPLDLPPLDLPPLDQAPPDLPIGSDRSNAALDARSLHLRRLIVRALEGGGRGHIGSSMSPVEAIRVLYDDVMRYRPDDPRWAGRDRFILSKGHGCLALYAVLADKGFFPEAALDDFCRFDSILGGHPEYGKVPGVEASTGALGHGLPIGVGMALAARMQGRDSRVFVLLGDGELGEGSVWEAALSAGKHRLGSLTALVDYNKLQSAGPVSAIQPLEPLAAKWEAFGFRAVEVDGHDVAELRRVLTAAPADPARPTAVICHTIKGRGVDFAEGRAEWHHKAKLSPSDLAGLHRALA